MENPFDSIETRLSNIETLLLGLRKSPEVSKPEEPDLITVPGAAKFLDLAVPTIYGLVHRQEVPHMKKGRRLYFSRKELTDWVRKGRRKTISELEQEAETMVAVESSKERQRPDGLKEYM